MRNFKLKRVAPLLTLVFAVGAAFATNSIKEVGTSAPVPGYIDSPEKCEVQVNCSDISTNPVCLDVSSNQVFGKWDPKDTDCPREVYKLIP